MLVQMIKPLMKFRKRAMFVPPGHFYSPIPSLKDIEGREDQIWGNARKELIGIDMQEKEQLRLLKEFKVFYEDLPFQAFPSPTTRYHYENPHYSYADGIFLYSMMRKLKPSKIIEIGSGFSSCVMLDCRDLFLNSETQITFIEPFPDLLLSLVRPGDIDNNVIIPAKLQDIDHDIFLDLGQNDILFVDSTHVSKINSDVNHIFFDILPKLKSGVYIHFHDIFYPFEYPREWVLEGRAWNENYMIRAFLSFNNEFKIVFFGSYLMQFHRDLFAREMPLCLLNPGGSIWLQRA